MDIKEQFTLSILLQRLVYYKRKEIKTHRDTERRVPGYPIHGQYQVKTEAEIGLIHPKAKEHKRLLANTRG